MSSFNYVSINNGDYKMEGSKLISVKAEGASKIADEARAALNANITEATAVAESIEDAKKPVSDQPTAPVIEAQPAVSDQPTAPVIEAQPAVSDQPTAPVIEAQPAVSDQSQSIPADNQPVVSVDIPSEAPVNVAGATFQPAPAELSANGDAISDIITPFADTPQQPQPTEETNVDVPAVETPAEPASTPDFVVPVSIESPQAEEPVVSTTSYLSDEELTRQMNDLLNKSGIKQNEIKKMIMSYFNAGLYFSKIIDRVETVNLEAAHIAKDTIDLAKVNQAMQQNVNNQPSEEIDPLSVPTLQKTA